MLVIPLFRMSKVKGARAINVVFLQIRTPPSVFELELSKFQNEETFPWPKNCMIQNFDLGTPKKARGGPKIVKILNFFII